MLQKQFWASLDLIEVFMGILGRRIMVVIIGNDGGIGRGKN
jgi:hypothetical protein